MKKKIRALAIHLPQFHPIPENDKWWGKGFTEWVNVVKGKQVVKGQYQPHLPSDLGFYDLRLPQIRKQQALLAQEHDIFGFCYYHYWFNGKRLLEQPVNEILHSGEPDFPFCLCWANESWSRNWDGKGKVHLAEQIYSEEDDLNHIKYLCQIVFPDKRYIKVEGKPVFMVYRPGLFPDMRKTIQLWRTEAKRYGFPDIYVGFFRSFDAHMKPDDFGFDFASQFPPNAIPLKRNNSFFEKAFRKLGIKVTGKQNFEVFEYDELVKYGLSFQYPKDFTLYPGITPMWDNYVRRIKGGGRIFINSTPKKYEAWLEDLCNRWEPQSNEENFIFINAWNEWAEGNHLEPCQKWGSKYLEATKRVLKKYKG